MSAETEKRRILDPDAEYKLPEVTDPKLILELQLSDLAGKWRQTKDQRYVEEYHNVYARLREMGTWNGIIDLEAMLPDALMPKEFFE